MLTDSLYYKIRKSSKNINIEIMKKAFNTIILTLIATIMSIGFQSCNTTKPIDKSILDGYWTLTTLEGQNAKPLFGGPIPSLQFNFTDKTVAGSGGCNRYTAAFTLTDKNEFTASNPISTMKMCLNQNEEEKFLKAIGTPQTILSIENGLLTFTKDKKVLLQFEKGEAPKPGATVSERVTIENTTGSWQLKSLGSEDLSKLFTTKIPTIEFSQDGKVFGNSGCNTYRGTFKIEDGKIVFSPLAGTRMACPSLEGEGKFTKILTSPVTASINDGVLTFYNGDSIIAEFTKVVL